MPRGAPLPETQPESSADPLKALRLKLKEFKNRLLATNRPALWPPPDLAWREGDLNDLGALVHAVYMTRHKREGTTRGKELLWVDGECQSLQLFKTTGDMIRAVPMRPVAAIQRELVKIDPAYDPAHLKLSPEKSGHRSAKNATTAFGSSSGSAQLWGNPKTASPACRWMSSKTSSGNFVLTTSINWKWALNCTREKGLNG